MTNKESVVQGGKGKKRNRGQHCVAQGQTVGQAACAQLYICHSRYSVTCPVKRVSDMGGS